MKSLVKKLLNKLEIIHIAFFLFGVIVTESITWLLFKDIKKITAPGLSAIVAVVALSLAIYSAYQVKKWVFSKINEKAFKRSEELLEEFAKMMIVLARLKYVMQRISQINKFSETNATSLKEELREIQNDYFMCISKQILITHTFSNWGVIFNYKKQFDKVRYHLTESQSEGNEIRRRLYLIANSVPQGVNLDQQEIKTMAKGIIGRIDTVANILDSIMRMKYEILFTYNKQ
ncbi:hypothetical protein V4Y22_003580 [Escherichia coli]